MRIAIITRFSYRNNYGQRLQNIALVQYLKKIYKTDEIYTFVYGDMKGDPIIINSDVENKFLKTIPFNPFKKESFNNYDLYVFGSDQVFNFSYGDSKIKNDFFNGNLFVENGCKHLITYAVSDCLKIEEYKNKIVKNFPCISFREKDSYTYYNINNSTYNIDPVFLMNLNFWTDLEKKTRIYKRW